MSVKVPGIYSDGRGRRKARREDSYKIPSATESRFSLKRSARARARSILPPVRKGFEDEDCVKL